MRQPHSVRSAPALSRRMIVACVALGFFSAALLAQAAPTRVLTKAEAEYAEPFTSIDGVREMRDGRVLVVDSREKSVQLVDLRTGRVERVGRNGRGPGEYALPVALIALGGDSAGIVDDATRRILVVLPNGKTGGILRLEPPAGAGGDSREARLRAADDRGRLYATGSVYHMLNGRPVRSDSVPILRWTPGQTRADTAAWARQQGTTVSGFSRGRMRGISIGVHPFDAQDQWAAAADGRIAVADPETYRILWTDPAGSRTVSPPIAFTRLPLTEAHKEEWRASQRRGVTVMGDDDRGTVVVTPAPRRVEDPPRWPEYLPPFLAGALKFAPDGKLWVRRTGPAGKAPTFDVIDAQGRVTQQVVLPKRTRVVGFGSNGAIYVARSDDDDLEHLLRYRIN